MSELDALLLSPEFRNNPYPVYQRLRTENPVHWSDHWGCWVLTRFADVTAVLQDFGRFSSRGRVTNVIQRECPPEFLGQVQPLMAHFSQGLINVDPPDHTRLRRLVQKTFLPKTLDRLRPRIESIVEDLLPAPGASGEMDLVRDLSYPLPVIVIAELLGVPAGMRDHFKRWSSEILEFQAVPRADPALILKSQKALLEIRDYLREVIRERLREPREDLLSELAAVEEQGEMLSEEELLSTGVALLVAGHETTTNLISSAIWLFLRHPEARRQLRERPEMIPGAIEEVLRFEGPLQRVGRTATMDVELDGRPIRAGQTVLSLIGAANRDPAQFAEPERFDIARAPNRHVAFGSGPHFCLGAGLARLEAPMVIRAVLQRFPDLRLADVEYEWHSGVMRGLKSLPLRF